MAIKRQTRYRNFATLVYPESAPDNWLEVLRDSHLQIFVSPLHDKDLNPNGTPKKPHFHVMPMWENPINREVAEEFFSTFGGVGCEVVKTKRGYARYLTHMDNPEKYQYDANDVLSLGGADYFSIVINESDEFMIIDEIIDYIDEFKIENVLELYQLSRAEVHQNDWRRVVQKNIYLFDKFCSANYKERIYGKGATYVQQVKLVD